MDILDNYLFQLGLLINSIKENRIEHYIDDMLNNDWSLTPRNFDIEQLKNGISNRILGDGSIVPIPLNQLDDIIRKLGAKYIALVKEQKSLNDSSNKYFKKNDFGAQKTTKESELFFYGCEHVSIQIDKLINVIEFLNHKCKVFKIDFKGIILSNFEEKSAELIINSLKEDKYKLTIDNLSIIQQETPPQPPELDLLNKEPEDHTKFVNNQKYELLKEIDFFELPIFKNEGNLNQNSKHKVLAKILGCTERTARAYFNNDPKYLCTPENKKKVTTFLNSLKNSKG